MTVSFTELRDEYTKLLSTMVHKNASWSKTFNITSAKLSKNASIYKKISKATGGIPWEFIAVIHHLECGGNFSKHLHNGDSLKRKTVRVPAGRPLKGNGPFTFFESAVDALTMKGFDKIVDWSTERMVYELERYNGFGYRTYRNINSPYLWSGTNHYSKGKYVADGKYDSQAVSKQTGAVPVLLILLSYKSDSTSKTDVKKVESQPLTRDEVVNKSTKLSTLKKIRDFVVFLIASVGGLITADNLLLAKGWIGELAQAVGIGQLFGIAAILIFVWGLSRWIEDKSIQDYNDGRYIPSSAVKNQEREDSTSKTGE